MNDTYTLELDNMKQCIGFDPKQVNAKTHSFKADKNYYFNHMRCTIWTRLVDNGLATFQPRVRGISYHLTPKGAEYLGGIIGVKITLPKGY